MRHMGSQDGARNPWSAPSIQRGAPTGWGLGTMTLPSGRRAQDFNDPDRAVPDADHRRDPQVVLVLVCVSVQVYSVTQMEHEREVFPNAPLVYVACEIRFPLVPESAKRRHSRCSRAEIQRPPPDPYCHRAGFGGR